MFGSGSADNSECKKSLQFFWLENKNSLTYNFYSAFKGKDTHIVGLSIE